MTVDDSDKIRTDLAAAAEACDEPGCREAIEELYVYLDGHLDDARREAIRHHVEECGPCLDTFDFHAELQRVVSTRCQEQLPDGLRDRVLAAIESFDN